MLLIESCIIITFLWLVILCDDIAPLKASSVPRLFEALLPGFREGGVIVGYTFCSRLRFLRTDVQEGVPKAMDGPGVARLSGRSRG